jgi:endo-1,4-beta-D-glucanase Y
MKKRLLSAILFASIVFASASQAIAQTQSFPANKTYGNGLMPTNKNSQDAVSNYNTWKTNFVEACSNGRYRVKFDDRSQTVSEGIGYGMLLSAYAGDKTLFDGFWNYYKDNRNGNGVMNWKINGCSGTIGSNGATDADIDAAMALIVADYQWGTSGSINYKNDAKTLINAIKNFEVESGSYVIKPGDQFGGSNLTNPSYFAPGYFRAFATYMNDSFWNNVADKTYVVINNNLTANNAVGGLVSDWTNANGSYSSSAGGYANGGRNYSYDAARTPWRIAVDYVWYGNASAKTYSKKSSDFVRVNLGGSQNVKDGYSQNGNNISGYHNSTFVGSFAASAMGGDNQAHLNNSYSDLAGINDAGSYFNQTLKTLYLFLLTGNFYLPGAAPVAPPVVPPVNIVQQPYGPSPSAIPGKIEVENYDLGGNNLAYFDTSPGNQGGAYRNDDVDIEATTDAGGGYNIGYTATGEWLKYTVNVTTAGKYDFAVRVASTAAGKSLHIEMDGVNVTGTIAVPNTGGWQVWQTVTMPNITLSAGQKVMRVVMDTDGFNLNYVNVTASAAANIPPTIYLTAPNNNASYTAPASVTISANAADSDGSIAKVEFFNGSTLLATNTSAPYNYTWTGVAAGSYTITAKATDNSGAVTTSASASITVITPALGNIAPTVSLTAPVNNATYAAPASVTISANANDSDGSIAKVEFFNGSTLLATDVSTPYNYTWTGVAAGSYSITAKATDNSGSVTTSTPVSITVTNPTNPGTTENCVSEAIPNAAQWVVRSSWADQGNGSAVIAATNAIDIQHRQWGNSELWAIETGKSIAVVSGQTYTVTFDFKNDAQNPATGIDVGFATGEMWNGAILAQPTVSVGSGFPASYTTKTVTITSTTSGVINLAYRFTFNGQPNNVVNMYIKNISVCSGISAPQNVVAPQSQLNTAPLVNEVQMGANPFSDQTTIFIPYASNVTVNISMVDMNGITVWSSNTMQTNQTIYVGSGLPIGTYIVTVQYDGNKNTIRLLKQ